MTRTFPAPVHAATDTPNIIVIKKVRYVATPADRAAFTTMTWDLTREDGKTRVHPAEQCAWSFGQFTFTVKGKIGYTVIDAPEWARGNDARERMAC